MTAQLRGYTFSRNLSNTTVEAYQFVNGTHRKVVAWSRVVSKPAKVACADIRKAQLFTFNQVKKLRIVDLYNQQVKFITDNKKGDLDLRLNIIKIKIGGRPTYVDLNP